MILTSGTEPEVAEIGRDIRWTLDIDANISASVFRNFRKLTLLRNTSGTIAEVARVVTWSPWGRNEIATRQRRLNPTLECKRELQGCH